MPDSQDPAALPEEDVWSYPRPPALEAVRLPIRIVLGGITIASTDTAFRVLETSHPPVYYLPPHAFHDCLIEPADGSSFCEWKGLAHYRSLRAPHRFAEACAWSYPDPMPGFAPLRDHLAVYAGRVDSCLARNGPPRSPAVSTEAG